MFVMMNQPLDTTSRLHIFAWRAFTYPVRKSEAVGYLMGSMLYPFELLLTAALRESPTTEIMICRKPLR